MDAVLETSLGYGDWQQWATYGNLLELQDLPTSEIQKARLLRLPPPATSHVHPQDWAETLQATVDCFGHCRLSRQLGLGRGLLGVMGSFPFG